jgi:hypothetical protein
MTAAAGKAGTAGQIATGGAAGRAGSGVPPTAATGGTAASGAAGAAVISTGGTAASGTAGVMGSAGGSTGAAGGSTGTGTGTAGAGGAAPSGGETTGSSCLDGITNYEDLGPFKFEAKTSGMIKFWVPMVPAGCKVPVVHLANGTGATCSSYQGALERLASHGFLTACYEDPNTGAGTQGVMALDAAIAMFPDLADTKFGSTGHSQGGQAAFTVLELAEEKYLSKGWTMAGLAMEPASGFGTQPAGGSWQSVYGKIKSPMFMFSGTADMLVSEAWVQQAYDAMNKMNEVYWWSAIGATHIPTPVEPEEQISIPWFRWKLLGDKAACTFYKAMPGMGKWDKKMSENEAPCE